MAEKAKETAIIIDQKELLPGICDMWLRTEKIAKEAKAGQFVSVYCHDGAVYLDVYKRRKQTSSAPDQYL